MTREFIERRAVAITLSGAVCLWIQWSTSFSRENRLKA
jgi:hypothetical protein